MSDDLSEELVAKLREKIENGMTGLRITEFEAKQDRDHDGDPILRLQIVYDEADGEPSATNVSALARQIRPWLDTKLPNTFPVFRFLTSRDFADEAH
jgi:hypothetical protein